MKRRLGDGSAFALRCSIPDPVTGRACGRPTMRAAGIGLATHFCRQHVEHRARHGSHWHGTYSATKLKPYLSAATSYVRLRAANDAFITAAINAIRATLTEAGPVEIATRLKGLSAAKRAKIALARLRVACVPPERIVSIVLAVSALIEDDPKSHRTKEFRTVQIAKAVHRLASGTGWVIYDAYGRGHRSKVRAYPKSTGLVLRLMGRLLETPCELVLERHLPGVLTYKQRYGRRPKPG
ncbi:hypothetical protein [Bradyrhizobium sp. YR681]|uniref:hypothetical protein n=1 Tax=Bradyrhizobium sp. YR681 TaxID=1144344 RepID=UPI001F0A09BC|nr:hypothetical protein [Bradyrhizobium sp. YR681]